MSAPDGLEPAGQDVWKRIVDDLPPDWELDARERLVLEAACRQADQNAKLEASLAEDGATMLSSKGQRRLNGVATELRQGRIALERLLGSLALPSDEGATMTAAQRRAKVAADARWIRAGRSRSRRRGAA